MNGNPGLLSVRMSPRGRGAWTTSGSESWCRQRARRSLAPARMQPPLNPN